MANLSPGIGHIKYWTIWRYIEMIISAIDTHCHLNYGPREALVHNHLTNIMQEGNCYTAYWDKLSQISKAAYIEYIFASPFNGVLDRKRTEAANQEMFNLAQNISALYQWVIIDPQNDNTLVQAERMLQSEKCVGIKLHPVCHNYSLEQYGDKVFSFANNRSAIVQIHPEKAADYIVPFANNYPNVTFIMSHLGNEHFVNAVRYAKYGNVYVDSSGIASMKNMLIEFAVEQIGSERILFGTDTYAAGSQRGRIEYSLISHKDKENILRNNAINLFKLQH